MTFNFLRPGLTVNVEAKVQEQIILDSSVFQYQNLPEQPLWPIRLQEKPTAP